MLHRSHLGCWGAPMAPGDDTLDGVGVAFKHGLDAAVAAVPCPPRYAGRFRLLP